MKEKIIVWEVKNGLIELVEETELELYKQVLLKENNELEKLKFRFQRKCFEDIFNKLENINSSVRRSAEIFGDAAEQLKELVKHFRGTEEV